MHAVSGCGVMHAVSGCGVMHAVSGCGVMHAVSGYGIMHGVFEKARANKFSFRSAFIYMAVRAEFFTEREPGPLLADEYRRI